MSQDAAFSPCKQLLDVKGSSSTHKTIAVVNRGDCVAVWDPLTEEKKSTSKAVAKEDFLYVQLAHQGKNTVVVSPGVKDTVIRLYHNERLSDSVSLGKTKTVYYMSTFRLSDSQKTRRKVIT